MPEPHLLGQQFKKARSGSIRSSCRAPHPQLWRGFAARLAGGVARLGAAEGHALVLLPSHRAVQPARSLASGGMKRKTSSLDFFTERSLAAYLAVSDRTIRNWIRRGELPSYKLGAARRIDPADVEDFLARHRDGPRET